MAVIKNVKLQKARLLPCHIHFCGCVCNHMVLSVFSGPMMETDILTVLIN